MFLKLFQKDIFWIQIKLFQNDIFWIQIKSNILFLNCFKRYILDSNKIKYMILKLFKKMYILDLNKIKYIVLKSLQKYIFYLKIYILFKLESINRTQRALNIIHHINSN